MSPLSILADVASPIINFEPSSTSKFLDILPLFSGSISNLLSLASVVLVIIGTWKILEKAGEQGWKAIIPFYSDYTLYKVFWKVKMFWISLIPAGMSIFGALALIFSLFFTFVGFNHSSSAGYGGMMGIILSIMLIVAGGIFSFVLKVLLYNRISKAFGKSAGFTVGLVLLPPVFLMILGYGNAKFEKK